MNVKSFFNKTYCWTVLTFIQNEQVIGEMKVAIEDDYAFIYGISSYKERCGNGTNMINYLKSLGISKIEGDAVSDSIGFWNKFNPDWQDESFVIYTA